MLRKIYLMIPFLCFCTKKDFSALSDTDKALYNLGSLYAQRTNYLDFSAKEKKLIFEGFYNYSSDKNPDLVIKQNRHLLYMDLYIGLMHFHN